MFYAVAIGKNPGVYNNWNLAEKQIKGVKGAKYKKFKTNNECYEFIKLYNPEFYAMYKLSLCNLKNGNDVDYGYDGDDRNGGDINDGNSAVKKGSYIATVKSTKCDNVEKDKLLDMKLDMLKTELQCKCKAKTPQLLLSYFNFNLDSFSIKKNKNILQVQEILLGLKKNIKLLDTQKLSRYILNTDNILTPININNTLSLILDKSFINYDLLKYIYDIFGKHDYYHSQIVYTDGSLKRKGVNNISKLGYFRSDNISMVQPMTSNTTNNQCELLSIYIALVDIYMENYKCNTKTSDDTRNVKLLITIVSDSEYAIKALTKWKDKWIKNNWINSKNEPVKNRDIIECIIDITKKLKELNILVNYIHQNSHIKLTEINELNTRIQSLINLEYNRYLSIKRNEWYNNIQNNTQENINNHNAKEENIERNKEDNKEANKYPIPITNMLNISTYINPDFTTYEKILKTLSILKKENTLDSNMIYNELIKLINKMEIIKGNYIIDYLVQN
jgi:ribonuclease HI